MFAGHIAFVVIASDAGFSEVIDGSPYEVAYHIGQVCCRAVVLVYVARVGFCLHHNAARHAVVVALCLVYHVVVSYNFVLCGERVVYVPVVVPRCESRCDRTRRVEAAAQARELRGCFDYFDFFALDYLVADAPAEY